MISFVVYFHSSRIENLKQTIRFLKKRENIPNSEFILVCQDNCLEQFNDSTLINLNLDTYYKTKMCNIGVEKSKNNLIALLDSDRILPHGYFTSVIKKIKPRQFVSTWKMYKLNKKYTDEQIEQNDIEKIEDFKSTTNEVLCKNLFAGNTVFYKKDYLDSGGMDERFVGYGFADTDMTRNIMLKNYQVIWNKSEEIHLNHDSRVFLQREETTPEIFTAHNAIVYYNKWKIAMKQDVKNFINHISNKKCPKSVRKKLVKIFNFDIFIKI